MLTKQCLQKGHCQAQCIKARPWVFTVQVYALNFSYDVAAPSRHTQFCATKQPSVLKAKRVHMSPAASHRPKNITKHIIFKHQAKQPNLFLMGNGFLFTGLSKRQTLHQRVHRYYCVLLERCWTSAPISPIQMV
jgi:hypothetical protein